MTGNVADRTVHHKHASETSGESLVLPPADAAKQTKHVYPVGHVAIKRPVMALAEDIEAVQSDGRVCLMVGEAHPHAYNSKKFSAAVKAAHKQGATIEVITGPVVLEPEGSRDPNGLLTLLDKGLIKLYHRPARFSMGHFRVVDTADTTYRYRYYREYSHPPLENMCERSCEDMRPFTPTEFISKAEDALDTFEFWKSKSLTHQEALDATPPGVLFTTPEHLALLLREIEARGREFNHLTAAKILEVANDIAPDLVSVQPRPVRRAIKVPAASGFSGSPA